MGKISLSAGALNVSQSVARAQSLDRPSVIILTRNEEPNIAACLRSCLALSDDVVVLDSHSTDRTVEIAESFENVRVIRRHFDTEYKQRNFGLHEINYKHPWLYICDADEIIPPALVEEIRRRISQEGHGCAAFRLRYRNMYRGRWIKHATSYPVWIIRLVRPELACYEVRETNVHPVVNGRIGELREHFEHYSFNSGLMRWFQKHNYYSSREALEGAKVRRHGLPGVSALMDPDPMRQRRAVKNLSYFLKGRAAIRFLHSYVVRLGFLDGTAGFHYCAMVAMYEYWIELKIKEQEHPWDEANDRLAERLLIEGTR